MPHEGPRAAGTRDRSAARAPVAGRLDRTDVRPPDGAAEIVRAPVRHAVAAQPVGYAVAAQPAVAPARSGAGVPGRRTVTISGRGAERRVYPGRGRGAALRRPSRDGRRRPYVPRHERDGFRPDRTAAMAVALALLLILVAAASAHATVFAATVAAM